jgi:hypothetical protein
MQHIPSIICDNTASLSLILRFLYLYLFIFQHNTMLNNPACRRRADTCQQGTFLCEGHKTQLITKSVRV